MKVKIFQAGGKDAIDRLEGQINAWLEDKRTAEILHTHIATAGVAEGVSSGEMWQHLIVTIWHI